MIFLVLGSRTAQSREIHYSDFIMSAIAPRITDVTIVYSTVCPGADQRNHLPLHVTGHCEGTGEFSAQRASNTENVSMFDDVTMLCPV